MWRGKVKIECVLSAKDSWQCKPQHTVGNWKHRKYKSARILQIMHGSNVVPIIYSMPHSAGTSQQLNHGDWLKTKRPIYDLDIALRSSMTNCPTVACVPPLDDAPVSGVVTSRPQDCHDRQSILAAIYIWPRLLDPHICRLVQMFSSLARKIIILRRHRFVPRRGYDLLGTIRQRKQNGQWIDWSVTCINPFKANGVKWLHFKVFKVILV